MPKQVIRTQTRYQPDIHQWLVAQAKASNRSLNGQLMEILKDAKARKEATETQHT
jgi:predicted HicB family RNase H-like nuclease